MSLNFALEEFFFSFFFVTTIANYTDLLSDEVVLLFIKSGSVIKMQFKVHLKVYWSI